MSDYPNINSYLHRPLFANPPLCTLSELQDGTYSIDDLATLHEIMDLQTKLARPNK